MAARAAAARVRAGMAKAAATAAEVGIAAGRQEALVLVKEVAALVEAVKD